MGLTIHYNLRSTVRTMRDARGLVEQLRKRALRLPLESVGPMIERRDAEADCENCPRDDPDRWLLQQSGSYVTEEAPEGEYIHRVSPQHVIAFSTQPGPGSEEANFGLCRLPATIVVPDRRAYGRSRRLRTGCAGWRWGSFCKTQYASNRDCGGVENFLRCHLSVVALLDAASEAGLQVTVDDEGDYWKQRDAEALARAVGEWNEMVAAFAGGLKDHVGNRLAGPILQFSDFEHLEAAGVTAGRAQPLLDALRGASYG